MSLHSAYSHLILAIVIAMATIWLAIKLSDDMSSIFHARRTIEEIEDWPHEITEALERLVEVRGVIV